MNHQQALLELPPLSLYVHIPWCVKKCPYCDFNSHTSGDKLPEAAYIKALIADLEQEMDAVQGRALHSIFFGGGTPSLFSAKSIGDILTAIEKQISFAPEIEITLEANPGTVEQRKFAGFRQAGINRLSIGIQSFNDQQLHKLGRIHNSSEAKKAVRSARNAGFDNFNLDLMHGLEGQTTTQALSDLEQAIALEPKHLSWYQLTIEPNTVFYTSPPIIPNDESLADIQQAGEALLDHHGYQQYEVSAYARHQQASKHNLNYWQFGDYIAIGAGAHGKNTHKETGQISRNWKTRSPKDYLSPNSPFEAGRRVIPPAELPLEFMMNVLRLNSGFNKAQFGVRTGLDYAAIETATAHLIHKGLLEQQQDTIKPTPLGRRFLNELLAEY